MNLKWILDGSAVLMGSYELWIPLDYNNINTGIPMIPKLIQIHEGNFEIGSRCRNMIASAWQMYNQHIQGDDEFELNIYIYIYIASSCEHSLCDNFIHAESWVIP